ncbi:hypothetical protein Palpr_2960 [Paludibacter propionicigenes WB4]|uniref:STAS/SEC14 domain-containing protein n=1 Tax=Paludibacter propionicigenes (strain DSM 17365 / JCM 13257 / WB4) TaxID=694427 RepID=E4T0M5_PALPW|nr:hypothetical protein [Paludibacter propionicigenes]ADQ81089.1 hypothetical protein Palpr_2960 [Paludibacter propionicigenes WB4]
MEHSYSVNDINKTIIVIIVGDVNAANFAKLDAEICMLAFNLNYKIIFDFSQAAVTIGMGEAYFWFTNHLDKINMLFRKIPTAHIANNENENFFHFVETTWTNHGIKTGMFKDLESAVNWLAKY